VSAQRGRGGGFQAARPANEISVLEVVSAVDAVRRIHTCPLGLAAHGTNLCPLHRKLDDAARSIEEAFRITSIGSLAGVPFCPEEESCAAVAR
jgi:DNA-binding IscR family transcriptional regulator